MQGGDSLSPDFGHPVSQSFKHVGVDLLVHRLVDLERIAQALQEPVDQHTDSKPSTGAEQKITKAKLKALTTIAIRIG